MSNYVREAVVSLANRLDRISAKVSATFNPSSTSSKPISGSSNFTDGEDGNLSSSLSANLLLALAPFEEYFVSIQSILIWERPYVSAVFLIAINCLYWLIVSWTRRFFSIVSLLCLLLSLYQCWSHYVWPEIRARPPEATEEWVPVNPKVLSAPELTHYINEIMLLGGEINNWIWQLRKDQPGLFCSLVSILFMVTAIIGGLVPGVVIVYIMLMTVALGPGVALYVIPETWYQTVRNYFAGSRPPTPSSESASTSRPSSPPLPSSEPEVEITTPTSPAPITTSVSTATVVVHDDHLSVSSSEEKEQGRKLSEGYVKCDQLEESFELDKDESSLQLLSDSKLEATMDLDFNQPPSNGNNPESSSPSSSNNSSLQLVPSMQFGDEAETGDELEDYEIISDSDLPLDLAANIHPSRSRILFQKSKGPETQSTATIVTSENQLNQSISSTSLPLKDMLESDL